jgi:beta-lactamase class A
MKSKTIVGFAVVAGLVTFGLSVTNGAGPTTQPVFGGYVLDFTTAVDPALQAKVESIDLGLREKYAIGAELTNVGLLDLARGPRLAMIHPDHEEYGASVPKIAILLAYFEAHPEAAGGLDPAVRHELGLMIKRSSNELASKYSHELGLANITLLLTDKYHFYDSAHGGGIWMGKHYGKDAERHGSPVGDNSHAVTVRQLLRYYLMLEQGKLVSPQASKTMREIFASGDIPHDENKFVKGLKGSDVSEILRKSGTWEDWLHDSAIISGPGRHYILVGVTRHPKGDEYLEDLAREVDEVMRKP